MNIVFDKKTLKVVSSFDNKLTKMSDSDILKQMFPNRFENLSLWQIDQKIDYNLINLRVKLDNEKNPEVLIYNKKEVYRRTEDEKRCLQDKKNEENRLKLSRIMPRTLRSSMGYDMIKMWIGSSYTHPYISESLKDLEYFSERIMPVSWWGTFVDAGGYGCMNRSIVFRLHNYHVITRAEIMPSLPQISSLGQYYVHRHASFDFRRIKRYPKVYGFGPHPHPSHNGRSIFYTMMETETLHPAFRDLCNRYSDEVWVPSSHNKKLFEEGGVKKPILLMPLGIDEVVYGNTQSIENGTVNRAGLCDILGKSASKGINSFRFFTVFGWSFRKGIDVLLKSFVKAFSDKDNVALIIASTHVGPDVVVADARKYASTIRSSNYPQILFVPGVTPELDMPSLYKMGHVFLHTSRGEGFSLPQIEAAACGLPVISCNNTGMGEYLTEDNSFMITTNEKEMCSPEMHWISGYYHGQLFPKLGNDQIEQAVKHMHYVINNYDQALKRAKKLKQLVFEKYTWDKTAERVSKRIKEIYNVG